MVDFKALLNRTPEESRAQSERINAEYAARMDERVAERTAMLVAIEKTQNNLREWDRKFIGSMQRKAEEVDQISNKVGGALAFLSDAQMANLTRIHQEQVQTQPEKSIWPQRPR